MEPLPLRAEPSVDVTIRQLDEDGSGRVVPTLMRRGPHRSTRLHVLTIVDVAGLMDEHGRPLVAGDDLEHLLAHSITLQVRAFLEEGRRKVPGHP